MIEELEFKICPKCRQERFIQEFKYKKVVYPWCRKCKAKETNYEDWKYRRISRVYGIDFWIYQDILKKQNGACAICRRTVKLCVDHDKATGKVRGLLCHSCNVGLGLFGDNVGFLNRAIEYLTLGPRTPYFSYSEPKASCPEGEENVC